LLIELQDPAGSWAAVGTLQRRNERSWFEFLDDYWNMARRPVLGQVFEEQGRRWQSHTNVALPRWFSHLLPEGMLRAAVAAAAGVSSNREFELLMRLGATDLPGAVRATSTQGTPDHEPRAEPDHDESGNEPLLKFSLAGAQLKFSVYGDGRGLTVPVSGRAGNYILKFPDNRPGFENVPEREFSALELARAAGIDVPQARLVAPNTVRGLAQWAQRARPGSALAVERFDRGAGDQRVHMEEIAQVLNVPTLRGQAKYRYGNFETVAVVVESLTGTANVGAVIDRLVLNILVGNGDAHLKNWAFTYPDGRNPSLSPLYDVLPTVLFIRNDDLGMNLNGSKSFAATTVQSFGSLGRRTEFGQAQAVARAREATERVLAHWAEFTDRLDQASAHSLTERLGTLELLGPRHTPAGNAT
jgi:serine/threonine-protein kinase HipA